MSRRGPAAVALTLVAALAACGGDDAAPATTTSSTALPPPDTGVRLPDAGPAAGADGERSGEEAPPPVDLSIDDLPDGWPQGFPIPEGAIIDLGSATTIEGGRVLGAQLSVADTTPRAVVSGYLDALDVDGFTLLRDRVTGAGPSAQGTVTFETKAYVGDVLAVGDGDAVSLTLTATFPPG